MIKQYIESAEPVQSCDFYPTFLEAAGLPLKPEQHRDGVSLMPIITRESNLPGRALFWHFPHYGNQGGQPAAWVLRDGWKLIHRYDSDSDELFYIASDISEANECSNEFPEIAEQLRVELKNWQEDVEAKIPAVNPEWERLYAMVPKVPNNAHE
jgi:arylsulfatase A-like enzyme